MLGKGRLQKHTDVHFSCSFHEIGYYDATAFIDHILQTTGQEKVFYIGHSQGTTAYFAMAASRPEYNDKIRLMTALAPVSYMQNIPSPILRALAENELLLSVSKVIFNTINFLLKSVLDVYVKNYQFCGLRFLLMLN